MTWTYNTALTANKDKVRFLVGDTDQTDQLVQDEEIAFTLTSEGNVFSAAALVAETLSGKFSNAVDKSIGDLKLKLGQRSERFAELAKSLRRRVSLNVGFTTAGAESRSSKDVDEADFDLVGPFFTRDMHEAIPRLSRDSADNP